MSSNGVDLAPRILRRSEAKLLKIRNAPLLYLSHRCHKFLPSFRSFI